MGSEMCIRDSYQSVKRFQKMWGAPGLEFAASVPMYPVCNFKFIEGDEMATKIYNSYEAFKQDVIEYHEISEKAFIEMRDLED